MSDSGNETDPPILLEKRKRKRKILNPEDYDRNKKKICKLAGKEYETKKGKVIPMKNGPDIELNCCKKNECLKETNLKKLQNIRSEFYRLKTKDLQDFHLQRSIELKKIIRRRGRKETSEEKQKPKSFNVLYHLFINGERIRVCKKAFIYVYNVTNKRMERIITLLEKGETPEDLRGKIRVNKIPPEILDKIHAHIESFPVKESHYSNKLIKYLASDLNVTIMHELFLKKYPELTTIVKYNYYYEYFKNHFDLKFGRPAVDTCGDCEEFTCNLKNPNINDAEKKIIIGEQILHKNRSKEFYKEIQKSSALSKEKDSKILGICFDFMAIVSLPKIPVQEIYYYRQLSVNTFGVYNLGDDSMTCFVYHEGIAKKSPDDVTSFVLHYLNNFLSLEKIEELHIFCDNCGGQNKNHAFIRTMMALVELKMFKKIKIFFPLRGHSYLPCDRAFGLIKRSLRKVDRIYTVDQYIEIIEKASRIPGKFKIMMVDNSLIMNYQDWFQKYYLKQTASIESRTKKLDKTPKEKFLISQYHFFEFSQDTEGAVATVGTFITGSRSNFRLRRSKVTEKVELPEENLYNEKVPIMKSKIEDLIKVESYIPEDFKGFWSNIYNWPTKIKEV